MTLTQIINKSDKDMSAEEKVEAIVEIVNKARKSYGNEDKEITAPKVSTTEGYVAIQYLSPADKVAAASSVIKNIRVRAIETVECQEGAELDKEVERLIACDALLTNLESKSDSAYI